MTDFELNKRLHEIIGLCWHEHKFPMFDPIELSVDYGCNNCGKGFFRNIDFLTWEGFGVLKEWLQVNHGTEFYQKMCQYQESKNEVIDKMDDLNYPRPLAEAVVDFFKETS